MGFSVTKIIKNITMSLVFEPAPKTACLLYSSVTKKKKKLREKTEKRYKNLYSCHLFDLFGVESTS